nr:MAG TPA: tail component [Caudoviricetes sp.]
MSYADQLKRFKEMHEKESTRVWRAAMLEVMAGTIMDTPVLDGYLRGGWAAYLGAAGIGGLAPDKNGSIAMKQVSNAVSRAALGTDVWFVNRYPYAYDIEYNGHSQKAPEGMLRRNLARWNLLIENTR